MVVHERKLHVVNECMHACIFRLHISVSEFFLSIAWQKLMGRFLQSCDAPITLFACSPSNNKFCPPFFPAIMSKTLADQIPPSENIISSLMWCIAGISFSPQQTQSKFDSRRQEQECAKGQKFHKTRLSRFFQLLWIKYYPYCYKNYNSNQLHA